MISEEKKLDSMNDMLNPAPPKFGMPWYAILGVLTLSVVVFLIPHLKMFGMLLAPSALGFGWWLTKEDPKEPHLILHELVLPSEFDPGKRP